MEHNHKMLEKRGEEWGEKVKIICISIDQTRDALTKHVEAKGWTKPIHYHRDKSDCSEQYSVRGVPNVMIIDTKGKIVFKGHPANRSNLEQDFDDLLAGKEITGAGTAAEEKKDGEGEKKEEEAGKEVDTKAIMEEIDGLKVVMKGFQED